MLWGFSINPTGKNSLLDIGGAVGDEFSMQFAGLPRALQEHQLLRKEFQVCAAGRTLSLREKDNAMNSIIIDAPYHRRQTPRTTLSRPIASSISPTHRVPLGARLILPRKMAEEAFPPPSTRKPLNSILAVERYATIPFRA